MDMDYLGNVYFRLDVIRLEIIFSFSFCGNTIENVIVIVNK